MALGHNATDNEETDEMMVPPKAVKAPSKPPKPVSDPGHMNMKGVFLHVLSDALGEFLVLVYLHTHTFSVRPVAVFLLIYFRTVNSKEEGELVVRCCGNLVTLFSSDD